MHRHFVDTRGVPLLRAALVLLGLLATLASAAPGAGTSAAPPVAQSTDFYCFSLLVNETTSSLCTRGEGPCVREREDAAQGGAATGECMLWQEVSCFSAEAAPGRLVELCAANAKDCAGWRTVATAHEGREPGMCLDAVPR